MISPASFFISTFPLTKISPFFTRSPGKTRGVPSLVIIVMICPSSIATRSVPSFIFMGSSFHPSSFSLTRIMSFEPSIEAETQIISSNFFLIFCSIFPQSAFDFLIPYLISSVSKNSMITSSVLERFPSI